MKNKKHGFSLAEVLIAVTIAAIIATMGFSIAKKGIARAYNTYIYSGYYAISSVLSHTQDGRGLTMLDCPNNLGVIDGANKCDFSEIVVEALSGRHVGDRGGAAILDFDTPNGTNYRIHPMNGMTQPTAANPHPLNRYLVRMQVPAVKRNRNTPGVNTICMVYVENFTSDNGNTFENILIPTGSTPQCRTNIDANTIVDDIQTRKDLLAFYIDDGTRGKVIEGNYRPRTFRSAGQAMCIKYRTTRDAAGNEREGDLPNSISPTYLDCRNIPITNPTRRDWENPSGILKVTDPRRI